jgi:predicted component of type VI protein secretion system
VRFYTNDEWDWQLRLLLRDVDIPGVRLGASGSQIGWTTWLGVGRAGASDVVIQERRAGAPVNSNHSGAPHHG